MLRKLVTQTDHHYSMSALHYERVNSGKRERKNKFMKVLNILLGIQWKMNKTIETH